MRITSIQHSLVNRAGLFLLCLFNYACNPSPGKPDEAGGKELPEKFLMVLGIAQDAGYPQAGCQKVCCTLYYEGKENKKLITCLALVDRRSHQYWLLEATPDIGEQLHRLQSSAAVDSGSLPSGILITHAHIGHYAGLMQLGREAMGASRIPVYAMPRLDSFLRNNGPWSQLVQLQNILLQPLSADAVLTLGNSFTVQPIRVPHRDEYSETVGFRISSGRKKILFIPDIDKWEKWEQDINALVEESDIAFLDATFFNREELPGRDMSEIPHPFVSESLQRFSSLPSGQRSKIVFIHFNHTNPLLKKAAPEKEQVKKAGMAVAEEGMMIEL